jgi:hypothetical protein
LEPRLTNRGCQIAEIMRRASEFHRHRLSIGKRELYMSSRICWRTISPFIGFSPLILLI